ncbi:uncharacterized protein LOC128278946 [Anopheles cruzii]|uniref:uncharacterized protein LOC128278946 n=1 Tax=Anopheles cruzii TaxID=68878 RepID=UPI0022EC6EB9|nr:uncharacterized protein LOC128278946 [Anopheles cruzii]
MCFGKGRTNQITNFLKEHWMSSNFTPSKNAAYLWTKVAQAYLFISPNANIDEDNNIVCDGFNSTCNLNLEVMRNAFFPTDCKEVFISVKYKGQAYDCDQLFKFSLTEMGSCFTTNSIYNQ